jgi:hypothetical protein
MKDCEQGLFNIPGVQYDMIKCAKQISINFDSVQENDLFSFLKSLTIQQIYTFVN